MAPTISILVTSHNYSAFLPEALASIQRLARSPEQVIVVDDGSTDGSFEIASKWCEGVSGRLAIQKENGGQLSAFHAGLKQVTGDYVAFLDADDVLDESHLNVFAQSIGLNPGVDFFFSDFETFPARGAARSPVRNRPKIWGSSRFSTMFDGTWIGAPTSCLLLSAKLLRRLLPYPHVNDWRTRADDVLVLGSSLLGAAKVFTGAKTVRYRTHQSNAWLGRRTNAAANLAYFAAQSRLFAHYLSEAGDSGFFARHREYPFNDELRTIEPAAWADVKLYLLLCVKHRRSLRGKMTGAAGALACYFNRRAGDAAN